MPDEGGQQPELIGRQRGEVAADADLTGPEVQLDEGVLIDLGLRPGCPAAPQQCLDPGDELGIAERLGEIVVRAQAQAADLVDFEAVRGKQHDRHVAQVTDALEHPPAVERRQPEVEQDDIRPLSVEDTQAKVAVGGLDNIEPGTAKDHADGQRDVLIVFDAQDAGVHWLIGR